MKNLWIIFFLLCNNAWADNATQNSGGNPSFELRDTTDNSAYQMLWDDSNFTLKRGTNTTTDPNNFSATQTVLQFNSSNQPILPTLTSCNKITTTNTGLMQCAADEDNLSNNSVADLNDVALTNPSAGQILINDGAGQFKNKNISGDGSLDENGVLTVNSPLFYQSRIQDADSDTLVDTEQDADEDIIRFYTGGTQAMTIDNADTSGYINIIKSGTSGILSGLSVSTTINNDSASTSNVSGGSLSAQFSGSANLTGLLIGGYATAQRNGSSSSGTVSDMRALYARVASNIRTTTNAYGVYSEPLISSVSDATVTNMYGFYTKGNFSGNLGATNTITNLYGIYLDTPSSSSTTITNRWGIYQVDSLEDNYFEGDLVIGATIPLGRLSVDGDTDTNQLLIQGHSTQTNTLATFENSSGTDQLTIGNTGNVTMAGDLTITGDDLIMATNTVGMLLIADGTNFNPTAMSGDASITSAGVIDLGASVVGATELSSTTVTAGTYEPSKITVDGDGRLTAASSSTTNSINKTFENLTSSDDNMLIKIADANITIQSCWCRTSGFTTQPTISLENDAGGNLVGVPTCNGTSGYPGAPVTAAGALTANVALRMDISNTPLPVTGTQTILECTYSRD